MMSYVGYVEIAIETILIFGAFFVIGSFLRVQVMGGHAIKLLIFFAIFALTGGLLGAHFAPGAIARHGMVNDHVVHCFRYREIQQLSASIGEQSPLVESGRNFQRKAKGVSS